MLRRKIELWEDFARIVVATGGCSTYSLIDVEDIKKVDICNWSLNKAGYVVGGYRYRQILLHRLITACPQGRFVDHINGDPLDNRKSNLRICTLRENNYARHKNWSSTGYKGVHWDKSTLSYKVIVQKDGTVHHGGRYKNLYEAILKYNELARNVFGEFAVLNEVPA